MPHPRVSVLILTWNGLDLLRQCLPSVAASSYPNLEVVVVDNGSTDGSTEWVRERFPEVRVIRHAENLSFCRGYNRAIPEATGDYLVLLNNDVEVPPGWLEPLVDRMEREPDLGAVNRGTDGELHQAIASADEGRADSELPLVDSDLIAQ